MPLPFIPPDSRTPRPFWRSARPLLAAMAIAVFWTGAPRAAAPQRVTMRTDDGVMLAGTWYGADVHPAPAVILVHMLNRSKREWDTAGRQFASAGIAALAIDLRGHGESGGALAVSDPVQPDYAGMVLDVRAARRYLAQRADVQQSRVGMAGASLGANLVALEASADPTVAAVALLSPSLDYRGLRIEAAVRKLGDRRLLLVASDDDPYAVRSARELQKGSDGTREFWMLKSAGHGTAMLARDPDLPSSLVDWFRRTLL